MKISDPSKPIKHVLTSCLGMTVEKMMDQRQYRGYRMDAPEPIIDGSVRHYYFYLKCVELPYELTVINTVESGIVSYCMVEIPNRDADSIENQRTFDAQLTQVIENQIKLRHREWVDPATGRVQVEADGYFLLNNAGEQLIRVGYGQWRIVKVPPEGYEYCIPKEMFIRREAVAAEKKRTSEHVVSTPTFASTPKVDTHSAKIQQSTTSTDPLYRLSNRELAEKFGRIATIAQKRKNAQEGFGVKLITTIGRWSTHASTMRMIRERLDSGAISREEVIFKIQEMETTLLFGGNPF